MADDALLTMSAVELGRRIRALELSPVEFAEAALARAGELNPLLGAFITVTGELALAGARAAAQRAVSGTLISPLDGIPFSLKDLEATAGIRTTYGSRFTADFVPDFDSVTAARLRASGGTLLGKTNTPQLGYKDACDNLVAATGVNPWDRARTPGGSSGGAAAAVAAGLGPVAQGSDGAGSIRIPSSLCGVVGLKPSFGLVPVVPSTDHWAGRVHNGPIARTVADAALLLSVMAGADDADPLSFGETGTVLSGEPADVRGLRVAWSADFGYGAVDPDVRRVCEAAVGTLSALGAEVENCDPAWPDPADFHRTLYSVGLATVLADRAAAHPEWIEPTLHALIERGLSCSARELKEAETARSALFDRAREFFGRFDILVSPTVPITAWPLTSGEGPLEVAGHCLAPNQRRSFFVYPFNLTGQPALSLPCGLDPSGLPVGLQIVGRPRRDDLVLGVGAALEEALGFRLPLADPRTHATTEEIA
jgi:Asp-tRNA(Asn)/Glu-tRNA(Gln) amidotransferase A subunit family amidase